MALPPGVASGAIDAPGLEVMGVIPGLGVEVIGVIPGLGLRPGMPEESPGKWGLLGFGFLGLFGTCAGLLPGILGLVGWLWAERNERAALQTATVPKYVIALRARLICTPLFWVLKFRCI